jgi:hypothetical protein
MTRGGGDEKKETTDPSTALRMTIKIMKKGKKIPSLGTLQRGGDVPAVRLGARFVSLALMDQLTRKHDVTTIPCEFPAFLIKTGGFPLRNPLAFATAHHFHFHHTNIFTLSHDLSPLKHTILLRHAVCPNEGYIIGLMYR